MLFSQDVLFCTKICRMLKELLSNCSGFIIIFSRMFTIGLVRFALLTCLKAVASRFIRLNIWALEFATASKRLKMIIYYKVYLLTSLLVS